MIEFKPGDRVVVVEPALGRLNIGDEYTIKDSYNDGTNFVSLVEVPEGDGGWLPSRFELVNEEKEDDMTNESAWIFGVDTISAFLGGKMYTIDSSHGNFDMIKDKYAAGDWTIEEMVNLFSKEEAVKKYAEGLVEINGGRVLYNGEELNGAVVDRLLSFFEEGLPTAPLALFIKNLMENPSYKSREALYQFLEKYGAPITEDGCFIAWKNVREDFRDIHSGTFDNSPGQLVEMDRARVDDDNNRTCSAGLHACSSVYLDHFYVSGARTVAVKINPKDVVAIPTDYNSAKMRVCKYLVLTEVEKEKTTEYQERTFWYADVDEDEDSCSTY